MQRKLQNFNTPLSSGRGIWVLCLGLKICVFWFTAEVHGSMPADDHNADDDVDDDVDGLKHGRRNNRETNMNWFAVSARNPEHVQQQNTMLGGV